MGFISNCYIHLEEIAAVAAVAEVVVVAAVVHAMVGVLNTT